MWSAELLLVASIGSSLPLLVSSQAIAANSETITITDAPGFKDQDQCAQNCIWGFGILGVASFLGCETNACLCRADHLYAGMQFISSCAVATCSDFNDATGGMAVLSAYCAGQGSTSVQTPTSLDSSAPISTRIGGSAPAAGVTPSGGQKTILSLVTITPTVKDLTATITTTDPSGSLVTETIMTALPVVTQTDKESQLSESDKIALGVGLGMGVPTFLVTMWACWKIRPSSRRR